MLVVRPARPRTLLALLLALLAGLGALAPAAPAAATAYGGAVAGSWPTAWTAYTYANGTVIGDTNGDQAPPSQDLASGTCAGCVGNQPSVLFANDGTSAFFRMRMAVDNNDTGKGGLFGGAFLVQIADATNTVRAVVGVDGKDSVADTVYVTNAVGGTTEIVYEYPFVDDAAGMRWIPVGDGTGQYFLDFQVPVSVVGTVSGGTITPTTPVKLYYGSSAAANLATINKDLMIPGATGVDFTTLAVTKLIPPTYAVTFDSAGGSPVSGQTVTEGEPAVQPATPTRSGHTFAGWYAGASAWSFATPVTGATTLTAHWARPSHAVSFDSAGGSAVATQQVEEGSPAVPPATPIRTGWTFAGWYDGASAYDFATPVAGATTLTAHWTRVTYGVAFDADGGSAVDPQTVAHGDPAAEPSTPTRPGWTFTGWFDGAEAWDFAAPVTGATTLTARWARVAHTVAFDSDGGSAVAAQQVEEDAAATEPVAPTRSGWTFDGWFDGATAWDFTTPVTGATTLTAHWTRNTVTVTFDTEGGGTIPSLVVDEFGVATRPADPTRAGFVFRGWYSNGALWNFANPVTTTTALAALWAPDHSDVSFDADGGSAVATQSVAYGDPAATPAAPTRAGWTFTGWFDGATSYDFAAPVTGPVALVAHWVRNTVTVTFDTDGGGTIAPLVVDELGVATRPADPARPGFVFLGWFSNGTAWDFTTPVTATTALAAHWAPAHSDVTFDADGGSPVATQNVAYGAPAAEPTAPTRAGWVFTGWYAGATPWDFTTAVAGPVALTAHWVREPAVPTGDDPLPDTRDPDTDRDGLTDSRERTLGTDPLRADSDGDGVTDGDEVGGDRNPFGGCGTDPLRADTDRDGLRDGRELHGPRAGRTDPCRADTDRDGLSDGAEAAGVRTPAGRCTTDPLRADSDRDGLADERELHGSRLAGRILLRGDHVLPTGLLRTDPCRADSDRDGLADGRELRGTRVGRATYRSDPTRADTDRDGLSDHQEVTGVRSGRYHHRVTDPMDWDTDDGGVADGFEVRVGSDPLDITSGPTHPRAPLEA